jgi:hypothetical protein
VSIDVQTEIRNTCLYDGGHFAVLMAMADCANTRDGDGIFPGLDLLAANARMKPRRTQDIIKDLRADTVVILIGPNGEDMPAEAAPAGGRGRKTEYRIDLERVQELQGLHEAEVAAKRVKCPFCEARQKRLVARGGKGAIQTGKGAIPGGKGAIGDIKGAISDAHIEPSEPSIEPSGEPQVAPPQSSLPGFDHPALTKPSPDWGSRAALDAAYQTYGEVAAVTGWAEVQKRTGTRDAQLRARLKDVGGIDGWKLALEKAQASDFLCGRAPPRDGRAPFRADLDFLIRESSFVKLMEGKYDNRQAAQGPPGGDGGVLTAAARVAARRAASGVV